MTGSGAARRAEPVMDRSELVHALTHTPIVLNSGADPTPVGGSRPLSGTEANDVADLVFYGAIREVRPVDDRDGLDQTALATALYDELEADQYEGGDLLELAYGLADRVRRELGLIRTDELAEDDA